MPDELTMPATSDSAADGGRTAPPEPLLARATRILSGHIRPDDYLPVSADVLAFVEAEETRTGVRLSPEYRQLLMDDLVLQKHHTGDEVLIRKTPSGVIVLAAGSEAVEELYAVLPRESLASVQFYYPGPRHDTRP